MTGPLEPAEPYHQRISDADRHKVAEVLREAAGDGRIDLVELDDRLEVTYAAKTYADLVPVLADLPTEVPRPPGSTSQHEVTARGTAPHHDGSIAIMSSQDRRGRWQIGERHTAFALMGSVVLDLREATFPESGNVEIVANAVMGSVDVYVDARTEVYVSGIPIVGEFNQKRDRVRAEIGPDSPVVRVRGVALLGGVNVRRKPMPGEGTGLSRWLDR